MSALKRPLFLISISLYLIVFVGRKLDFYFPELINSYLTDLLCMPVILTLCLAGIRILKRIHNFELTLNMVLGMTLFYAVFFEWYLPTRSNAYTADFVDAIMYFTGALIYYLIALRYQNRVKSNAQSAFNS